MSGSNKNRLTGSYYPQQGGVFGSWTGGVRVHGAKILSASLPVHIYEELCRATGRIQHYWKAIEDLEFPILFPQSRLKTTNERKILGQWYQKLQLNGGSPGAVPEWYFQDNRLAVELLPEIRKERLSCAVRFIITPPATSRIQWTAAYKIAPALMPLVYDTGASAFFEQTVNAICLGYHDSEVPMFVERRITK